MRQDLKDLEKREFIQRVKPCGLFEYKSDVLKASMTTDALYLGTTFGPSHLVKDKVYVHDGSDQSQFDLWFVIEEAFVLNCKFL